MQLLKMSWILKINRSALNDYLLVFAGGGIGSVLRYGVGGSLEISLGSTMAGSLSLLIVNVLGAMFLGLVSYHPAFASDARKSFWGVGFCGGFTTMSGVALFLYQPLSIPLTSLMFGLGFLGFAIGVRLGKASGVKK